MKMLWKVAIVVALAALAAPVGAQQLFVYPANGQSPEQQNRDMGECHNWAVQQSGFNPYQTSGSTQAGGVLRGAAGGAAVGAVGGAIAGNAGRGAAIGAASGGLIGGIRQHSRSTQQSSNLQSAQNSYLRAYRACLQGRGYTVS
jgi:hypothetical protein